jgi:hypothetical protein
MIREAITESRSASHRRRLVKEAHEGLLSVDAESLLAFAKAYAGLADAGLTMQLHDLLDNGPEADVTQEELEAIDAALGGMNQQIDDAISNYMPAQEPSVTDPTMY